MCFHGPDAQALQEIRFPSGSLNLFIWKKNITNKNCTF
jgi:hypothetical protein